MADQSDPVAVLREAVGRLYAGREGYEIQRACYESAEMALAELERRRDVEARLERWLKVGLRTCSHSSVGALAKDYRIQCEWFAIPGQFGVPVDADRWTLVTALLTAAGAEP